MRIPDPSYIPNHCNTINEQESCTITGVADDKDLLSITMFYGDKNDKDEFVSIDAGGSSSQGLNAQCWDSHGKDKFRCVRPNSKTSDFYIIIRNPDSE